ncbi:hypothetical protein GH714_007592 [Hevea brasiliensis]|uniref:Cytochrome b561 domain-containing protein n=1 Tax=Hevea brasiliensis TaxID=3981 RepID=A0A6A6M008_HEVBR|nr:hypothetical protein GH714_007592 [Hevea brasiliensis]
MDTGVIYHYRRSASRLTIAAHLFGILAFILMLIWLLHYRGGIEYDSDNVDRVFNVHPFMMFCGFIFLVGEAICLGIVGISAVFKFHDMVNTEDVYSLHSWIGIGTFCLFGLQWLFGLFTFTVPQPSDARASMLPWHICGAIMAYKTIPAKRKVQKAVHLTLHLIALVAGVVGVYAAFKFSMRLKIKIWLPYIPG